MARKTGLTEGETTQLLQRYNAGTLLALLREVGRANTTNVDWHAMWQKVLPSGGSAREVQALWRHLAYCTELADSYGAGDEPLEDASDLDDELEPPSGASREALADAAACVKADMERHGLIESSHSTPPSRKRKADGTTAGGGGGARPAAAKQKAANGQPRGGQKVNAACAQMVVRQGDGKAVAVVGDSGKAGPPILTAAPAAAGDQESEQHRHAGAASPALGAGVPGRHPGTLSAGQVSEAIVNGRTAVEGLAQEGMMAGKQVGMGPGGANALLSSGGAVISGNGSLEGLQGEQGRRRRKLWTGEEDEALIAAVEKYGEGNWVKILLTGDYAFQRTAAQLSQRWAAIKKRKERVMIYTNMVGMSVASGPSLGPLASAGCLATGSADSAQQDMAGCHVGSGGGEQGGGGATGATSASATTTTYVTASGLTDAAARQPGQVLAVAGAVGQGPQANNAPPPYTWGVPAVGTSYGMSIGGGGGGGGSAPMYAAAGVGPSSVPAGCSASVSGAIIANAGVGSTVQAVVVGGSQMGGGAKVRTTGAAALRLADNVRPPGSPSAVNSSGTPQHHLQLRGSPAAPPRSAGGVGSVGVSRRLIAPGAVVMSAAAAQAASVGGSEMWQATALASSSASSLPCSLSNSSPQPNPLVQAAAVAAGARIASTSGAAISPVALNVKPDPMVQAAALAAGARIAPASAAAELLLLKGTQQQQQQQSCGAPSRPFAAAVVARPMVPLPSPGPGSNRAGVSLAGRATMGKAVSSNNGFPAARLAGAVAADGMVQAGVGNPKAKQSSVAVVPSAPQAAAAAATVVMPVKVVSPPPGCTAGPSQDGGVFSLPAAANASVTVQQQQGPAAAAAAADRAVRHQISASMVASPPPPHSFDAAASSAAATAAPALCVAAPPLSPLSAVVPSAPAAALHAIDMIPGGGGGEEAATTSQPVADSGAKTVGSDSSKPRTAAAAVQSYSWAMTGLSGGGATWEVQGQSVVEAGSLPWPLGSSSEQSTTPAADAERQQHQAVVSASSLRQGEGRKPSSVEAAAAGRGAERREEDANDELVFTTGPPKPASLEFTTCPPTPDLFSFIAEPVVVCIADSVSTPHPAHNGSGMTKQKLFENSEVSCGVIQSASHKCLHQSRPRQVGEDSGLLATPAATEANQSTSEHCQVKHREESKGENVEEPMTSFSRRVSMETALASDVMEASVGTPGTDAAVMKSASGKDLEDDAGPLVHDGLEMSAEAMPDESGKEAGEESGLLNCGSPSEDADTGQPVRKRGRPPKDHLGRRAHKVLSGPRRERL